MCHLQNTLDSCIHFLLRKHPCSCASSGNLLVSKILSSNVILSIASPDSLGKIFLLCTYAQPGVCLNWSEVYTVEFLGAQMPLSILLHLTFHLHVISFHLTLTKYLVCISQWLRSGESEQHLVLIVSLLDSKLLRIPSLCSRKCGQPAIPVECNFPSLPHYSLNFLSLEYLPSPPFESLY